MNHWTDALSPAAKVIAVVLGLLYLARGLLIALPFLGILAAVFAIRAFPHAVRELREAAGLALGHGALLGVEYLEHASARQGVEGTINLVEIVVVFVGSLALMATSWRSVAALFVLYEVVALLPALMLGAMQFGTPDGWIYFSTNDAGNFDVWRLKYAGE